MDSFTGSYLMTAGVGASKSSTVSKTFRVDIDKMDDNRVIISGLASPIENFDPVAVAYFDTERHCLVLDPQYVCKYNNSFAYLSLYTGSSYVYASGDFLLGMVKDELIWVSEPTSTYTFIGYTFMEFSELPPTSSTYLKEIVNSKVFINPVMKTLEKKE